MKAIRELASVLEHFSIHVFSVQRLKTLLQFQTDGKNEASR